MFRLNLRYKFLLFNITIIFILLISSHLITSILVDQNLQERLTLLVEKAREKYSVWEADKVEELRANARRLSNSDWLKDSLNFPDPLTLREQCDVYQQDLEGRIVYFESIAYPWKFQIVDNPDASATRISSRLEGFKRHAFGNEAEAGFIRCGDRLVLSVTMAVSSEGADVGIVTLGNTINRVVMEDILVDIGSDNVHVILGDSLILSNLTYNQQDQLMRGLPQLIDPKQTYSIDIDSEIYLTRCVELINPSHQVVGHILIQFSNAQDKAILSNISNALNLSALLTFVVFSILSIIFTGRITDNLNRLVESIGALGEGEYEKKVEIDSSDEVGVLANSFDDLRIKLKERTTALVEANEDLDQRVREIVSLNNVMVSIASNLPMEEVIEVIVRETRKHIPCDFAFLALWDERDNRIRLLEHSQWERNTSKELNFPPGCNRVELLEEEGAIYLDGLDPESRYSDESWLARAGLKSAYYLPMLSEGKFTGAICVASREALAAVQDEHFVQFMEKMATEITVALQRLRLNEELQVIEGRLGRLFDSARDGIFQTDSEGELVLLNTAAQKLFGVDDLKEVSLFLQDIFPEASDMNSLLEKLERDGYVYAYSVRLKGRKGKEFDAELSVNYTDEDVGKRGIEGIIRDVTSRKLLEQELQRSEAFLRQVIEGTTNAIFTLDSHGRISFWNRQLNELSGLTDEALKELRIVDLVRAEDVESLDKRIRKVLSMSRTIGNVEIIIEKKDGSTITGLLSLAPLQRQSDDRMAVGAIADITEVKKLENQLIRSERLASMGEIAASVAHEINNPLGIILGFTQDLLSDKGDENEDVEPLKVIEHETQRCAKIVKDLLDMARADTVKRKGVDLPKLIDKTLPLFKLHFRDKNIRLEKDIMPVPRVLGDEHQLQQVLMNVIINSIHAMEAEENMLSISLFNRGAGEGKVDFIILRIKDNGKGIPAEHLDRIFDPFFTTKRKGGSGLGLFIVHRLVEAHGGNITVESSVGVGTTCTITLPVLED